MLKITIPETELYDDATGEFTVVKETTLQLEHSLVSLSKWESKWHKPFSSTTKKTTEETIDYVKCMTITQNVNPMVYRCLTPKNMQEINAYIDDPMTATTFSEDKTRGRSRQIITAEIIYSQMIELSIPFECQKWHLNRLTTLIRVRGIRQEPPKKMSKSAIMARNASLNAARRKALNTKG